MSLNLGIIVPLKKDFQLTQSLLMIKVIGIQIPYYGFIRYIVGIEMMFLTILFEFLNELFLWFVKDTVVIDYSHLFTILNNEYLLICIRTLGTFSSSLFKFFIRKEIIKGVFHIWEEINFRVINLKE